MALAADDDPAGNPYQDAVAGLDHTIYGSLREQFTSHGDSRRSECVQEALIEAPGGLEFPGGRFLIKDYLSCREIGDYIRDHASESECYWNLPDKETYNNELGQMLGALEEIGAIEYWGNTNRDIYDISMLTRADISDIEDAIAMRERS
jgi:hypothetical protein